MSHPRSSVLNGQAVRQGSLAVLLVLALAVPRVSPAQVPAEYQGTWVPVKATCQSPSSVVLTPDRLTLVNGANRQPIGGIEMAGPGYWGPDYNGIMAVLITEFDGQQPVTMSFNVGEKKGVAQVEFAPVMSSGNAQQAAYNARITQLNLARRFPLNKVPLKKCGGQSGPASGAGGATAKPATAAGPSVCGATPHCTEVKPFAATVTDFRTSSAGTTRLVTINLRFQNRTSAPLILGYVQGSGIVTDDRGNRYAVAGQGAVRGIGEINNNTFDPKFTLQPGEASDARIEFQWTPHRGQIFGTTYGVELAIREIESLPAEQYQLGKEYALKLDGFTAGTSVATAPPPGSEPVAPATPVARPADAPDACAGRQRCYNAGPFAAEVTQVTMSKVTYYVVVKLNVKVLNVTAQPLLLGWQNGSGSAIDDVGNRYVAKTVKGIGLVSASSADPQFALNPGQSRAFTVEYVFRANRSTVGTSWTAEFVLQQLEILPSRQVRSVREYSVSYQDLTAGNAGSTGSTNAASDGAASASSTSDSGAANAVNATAGAVKAVGKLFKSK
jgi:hypothetical protein